MASAFDPFDADPRPVRLAGESLQAWEDRLKAWTRRRSQGVTDLARPGIPAPTLRYAPSATGERLGDFVLRPAAGLPPPVRVASPDAATGTEDAFAAQDVQAAPEPSVPSTWPMGLPSQGVPPVTPLWAGPGGALPPGLRTPFDEPEAARRRRERLAATGFDTDWGEPPQVPGLAWDAGRALYVPTLDEAGSAYQGPADRGWFRQPYKDVSLPYGQWGWRWVDAWAAPYRILAPGEAAVAQLAVDRRRVDLRSPLAALRRGEVSIEEAFGPVAPIRPIAQAPPRPVDMTRFAWVPQYQLPAGCPYPYPYLPVPREDYVSGRWLSPDYTPSIPLPPPYDQTPWRCGVPSAPGTKHKGPPDSSIDPLGYPVHNLPFYPSPPDAEDNSGGGAGGDADLQSLLPAPGETPSSEQQRVLNALKAQDDLAEERNRLKAVLENASPAERIQIQRALDANARSGRAAAGELDKATSSLKAATGNTGGYAKPSVGIPPPGGTVYAPAPNDQNSPDSTAGGSGGPRGPHGTTSLAAAIVRAARRLSTKPPHFGGGYTLARTPNTPATNCKNGKLTSDEVKQFTRDSLEEYSASHPDATADDLRSAAAAFQAGFEQQDIVRITSPSSDAIVDIFARSDEYTFDCASGATVVLYKGVLDALVEADPDHGKERFDALYPYINIAGDHSTTPAMVDVSADDSQPGDFGYARNPDHKTSDWKGENFIRLGDGPLSRKTEVYGHPLGITTVGGVLDKLNAERKEPPPGEKAKPAVYSYGMRVDVQPIVAALRGSPKDVKHAYK